MRKSKGDPVKNGMSWDIFTPLFACVKCGRYMRIDALPKPYYCPECRRKDSYILCDRTPTNPNGKA